MIYSKRIYPKSNLSRTRLPMLDIEWKVYKRQAHDVSQSGHWLIIIHFNDYFIYSLLINVTWWY